MIAPNPDYAAESAAPPVLLVKGIAGLGNRVLSLLSATLYAEMAGRRVVVDWRDAVFAPQGDEDSRHVDLFPRLFTPGPLTGWDDRGDLDGLADDVYPAVWRGQLDVSAADRSLAIDPAKAASFGGTALTSAHPGRLDYPAPLVVMWSWRERLVPMRRHLRRHGPARGKSDFALLRDVCRRTLTPSVEVMARTDAVWAAAEGSPTVGLHVRQTDERAPVGKLLDATARTLDRTGATTLFLATDNGAIEADVRSRFADVKVVTLAKQFPPPGTPMHYDPSCRDRVSCAREALCDMLLLGRCDDLIYAGRSSFGIVARLFANDAQRAQDCDRWVPKVMLKKAVQKHVYR